MSNYDDLFRQENEQPAPRSDQPFDKEAWAQKKQEQREQVYTMIDDTAGAVSQDGAKFQGYLDVQGRFDRYSVSNALLIFAQKPNATRIADFDTWKEQGAYIRKKESGFYILEPGEEYQREDGTTGISYNPKKMFDITQTGNSRKRETPSYPDERTRLKALMDYAPVIRISDTLPSGVNALYQPDTREIQVRRGMDASSIFRALSRSLPTRKWIKVTEATTAPSMVFMPIARRICFAGNTAWKRAVFTTLRALPKNCPLWNRRRSAPSCPSSRRPREKSPAA